MFPGATDGPLSEAAYAIIGAPLDVSTTFYPGARFGPEQIRHFARGFEDFDHYTGQHFSELSVVDQGDLHSWNAVDEYLRFLEGEVRDICEANAIPIILGGEHTVAIAGFNASAPDVIISLDAHLDLREEFDGNSLSHATVMTHAESVADEIVIVGARSGSQSEWERAEAKASITTVEPESVRNWIDSIPTFLDPEQTVYLSLDIDVLDPAFAPATGTKEPGGLDTHTVRAVIEALAPYIVAADIVEVTDRDHGQTGTVAATMTRRIIYEHALYQ